MLTTKFDIETGLEPADVRQRLKNATVSARNRLMHHKLPPKDGRLYGKVRENSARLYAEPSKFDPPLLYCTISESESGTLIECKIVDGVYSVGMSVVLMIAGIAVFVAGLIYDWPIAVLVFMVCFELVAMLMLGFHFLTRSYHINKLRNSLEKIIMDVPDGER